MPWMIATVVAGLSGFAVMVLEIVGARFLARDFGSSLYVWTSQIGMVLVALTLGYTIGGVWADRGVRLRTLATLLWVGAGFTALVPWMAPPLMDAIVSRHALDREIAPIWQRLDPALGSALVFLPPCAVLATLPPFLIRRSSRDLRHVGRIGGAIYGAGSLGSIAGVFATGYWLIDWFSVRQIFWLTAALIAGLAVLCHWVDPHFRTHLFPGESEVRGASEPDSR